MMVAHPTLDRRYTTGSGSLRGVVPRLARLKGNDGAWPIFAARSRSIRTTSTSETHCKVPDIERRDDAAFVPTASERIAPRFEEQGTISVLAAQLGKRSGGL